MSLYRFNDNDIFHNVIKTHPEKSFYIYDSRVYSNTEFPSSSMSVYSFITKEGSRSSYSSITDDEFNQDFNYGDTLTGSSPSFLTSSIRRNYYQIGESRNYIDSLKNTLDHYNVISAHHSYSSSLGDKGSQELNLISIPSIYYGSAIKKGTVDLSFYISGTLVGQLKDEKRNGELIQVAPSGSTGSGSVAGVCLYKEGFIVLTGSWDLENTARDYLDDNTSLQTGSWVNFGTGIEDGFSSGVIPSASFKLDFKGTQKVPTMTMFATAPKGQLNNSQNPTFIKHGQDQSVSTSSTLYKQKENLEIKNVVSATYSEPTASFKKTTFISEVMIYDEDRNLLGIAKLARPIKKTEERDFTFKLKLDI